MAKVLVTTDLYPCEFCGVLCVAPANESLDALRRRGSRCATCTPGWVAKRFQETAAFLASQKGQEARIPISGAYIVQIVARLNCLKIGQAVDVHRRLLGIRKVYGAMRHILTIPSDAPPKLERELHAYFAAMRLYKGASHTEIFQFMTQQEQQYFATFVRKQGVPVIEPVQWISRPLEDYGQLALW
jgi:T5orf172 domain